MKLGAESGVDEVLLTKDMTYNRSDRCGRAYAWRTFALTQGERAMAADVYQASRSHRRSGILSAGSVGATIGLLSIAACAHPSASPGNDGPAPAANMSTAAPSPDPRVGLKAGKWDAAQAAWNMRLMSNTHPTDKFKDEANSDLAFSGPYAIQGNFNGFQVWDISNPSAPSLKTAYYCPASQSDVSVYKNLLVISGEGLNGRVDCGGEGVPDTVSSQRLRGVRIFDISDIAQPKYVTNVQTCRGSHTHTLLVDPNDHDEVYVYISGSAGARSSSELAGCNSSMSSQDPSSSLFRIEIIRVPLAHPEQAAIIGAAHIFDNLKPARQHGLVAEDRAAAEALRAKGSFTALVFGDEEEIPPEFTKPLLDSIVKARGGL